MKLFTAILILVCSYPAPAQSFSPDTVIGGIGVHLNYYPGIFPRSWRGYPINAEGEDLPYSETDRCKKIAIRAFRKYPGALLRSELSDVYFLRAMRFYGVGYGGTNSNDALYLSDNGEASGYTDFYLEQTFHHEFSSILYRNHPRYFDEKEWIAANFPGSSYNDPENGVGAIRNRESSQELDTLRCAKGFLTQYAGSGLENDINTFAQNLFCPGPGFWDIADRYPRIKTKLAVLVRFYNRLNPVFTETYFRELAR